MSTLFSGIRPLEFWKCLTLSDMTPSLSTCRSRSTNSPFSSTAFSLNSSTLIPLRDRLRPLTFALTRLESAYICRDNNPSLSSSSLNRWNISPKPSLPTRSMK